MIKRFNYLENQSKNALKQQTQACWMTTLCPEKLSNKMLHNKNKLILCALFQDNSSNKSDTHYSTLTVSIWLPFINIHYKPFFLFF